MGKQPKVSRRRHLQYWYPYAPIKSTAYSSSRRYHKHTQSLNCLDDLFDFAGPDRPLKHLAFVRATSDFYATKGFDAATYLYCTGRSWAPAGLHSSISAMEGKALQLGGPVLRKLLKAARVRRERAFRMMDKQVDKVLRLTHSCPQKALTPREVGPCKASASLRHMVVGVVSLVGEHGLAGTVALVLNNKPQSSSEREELAAAVAAAWEKISNLPGAQALLAGTRPVVEYMGEVCGGLHSAVVSSEAYSRTVDASSTVLKATADHLYPLVAPVLAPAVAKITSSELYLMLLEYLRPHPAVHSPKAVQQQPHWLERSFCTLA